MYYVPFHFIPCFYFTSLLLICSLLYSFYIECSLSIPFILRSLSPPYGLAKSPLLPSHVTIHHQSVRLGVEPLLGSWPELTEWVLTFTVLVRVGSSLWREVRSVIRRMSWSLSHLHGIRNFSVTRYTEKQLHYCSRGESVRLRTVRSTRQADQRVEAYTVHTTNIISQLKYFVVRCLISCVHNVFGLHSICVHIPSSHKLVT
jgi:hypothetical protein